MSLYDSLLLPKGRHWFLTLLPQPAPGCAAVMSPCLHQLWPSTESEQPPEQIQPSNLGKKQLFTFLTNYFSLHLAHCMGSVELFCLRSSRASAREGPGTGGWGGTEE